MSGARPAGTVTPASIPLEARPRLPRGVRLRHDAVRDEWMLLAPERIVRANPVAVAILERCTGKLTLAEIVDDLASAFKAEPARIETDVRALLAQLNQSRMVDL
jgi:pyrroloquinoline quinone biosynthesis protein D